MKGRWVLFAGAMAIALATAFGWGLTGRERVDPSPSEWLQAGETVRFRGLEFSDPELTIVEPTEEMTDVPPGATVAILRLTVEVLEEPEEEDGHYCSIELQTPIGTYNHNLQFAIAADEPYTCDTGADGELLAVGESQRITAGWILPEPPGVDARAVLRFPIDRGAVGVRF